ncbi:MAG: serine/threonine-protein kinase, partial [Planctomycetota bacterium]
MSADFETVAALFELARGLGAAEREVLLDERCGADLELRREVEALLEHEGGNPALSDEALVASRQRLEALVDGQPPSAGLPERIGPFEVVRRIGAGGMGVVYEARQESPARGVALKVLHATHLSPGVRRRFEREAEILARLRHPGIAQVFATGTCDLGAGEQPYFALELIEGRSLTAWADTRPLGLRGRLELLIELCQAIHHAHTQGVVHRDLKPDNVLVDNSGRLRVVDFGIAHVVATGGGGTLRTTPGEVLGTLAYMAPEQVRGDDAARAPTVDVYAVGAIAYELLTAELPRDVTGRALAEAVRAVELEPVVRLASVSRDLPRDVAWIVDKALESDPARRYGSTLALGDDLQRFLDGLPVLARPASTAYRLERFVRRNRVVVASLGLVLVTLAVALAVSIERTRAADRAREAAESAAAEAAAINEYLLERMLSAFGPLGLGQDLRVRDALDLAVPQIEEAFADAPVLGAAVRRTAGRSYAELGLNAEALRELERAHAEFVARLGPEHPSSLRSLVDVVQVLSDEGRQADAAALASRGLEAFGAADPQDAESRAAWLELRSLEAGARFETGERDGAIELAAAVLADAELEFGAGEVLLDAKGALAA